MNKIEKIIYEVDGNFIILSSDLAKLYRSKNGTKEINQTVVRNQNKFTEKDTWILEKNEINNILVTISDQKVETRGGKFNRPRVFTESGVKILSDILKTEDKDKITEEILIAFSKKTETLSTNRNAIISSNNNKYIENMIYEIRGVQVMLDSDLARIYECKNGTKTINLAVKRNKNRFPEKFMFKLTEDEFLKLRFQFETANKKVYMSRTLPYAFTEEGVAMLSSVLRTPVAEKISIKIMEAFITMRKYISANLMEQKYINNIVLEDHNKIKSLEESFKKFEEKRKVNEIYFNGEIYDAYSKIIDIFKDAKDELIIIDGYSDKTTLDMIKSLNCKVIIITKANKLLKKLDIEKYCRQYNNLTVKYNNNYHDRYFIIDRNIVYHCGSSINYAGSRTFSINILEDKDIKETLIKKVIEEVYSN